MTIIEFVGLRCLLTVRKALESTDVLNPCNKVGINIMLMAGSHNSY